MDVNGEMAQCRVTYMDKTGDEDLGLGEGNFPLSQLFSHAPNLKAVKEMENFKKPSFTQHITEQGNTSEMREKDH